MTNTAPLPPTLSRKRPPPTGDEEATSILKLGDMSTDEALSVAEAHLMLQVLEERREGKDRGKLPPLPTNDVYTKTKDYGATFARFKGKDAVNAVNRTSLRLVDDGLITPYERAQLATLCCDTAEEARTLIPSLEGKVSDEDLQQVLDDISKLRDFS